MSNATVSPTKQRESRLPRYVLIAAWAAPVMVSTGFALVSGFPILLALFGILRSQRLRSLSWWAVASAAMFTAAVIVWRVGPDPAPSLTKDMSLGLTLAVIVVAAAAAVRLTIFWIRQAKGVRARTAR